MLRSSGLVTSARSSVAGASKPRMNLAAFEHLDREAAADLDLRRVLRVEGRVGAEAADDAAQ